MLYCVPRFMQDFFSLPELLNAHTAFSTLLFSTLLEVFVLMQFTFP